MKWIALLIVFATLSDLARGEPYRDILELKYDAPIKSLEIISFSPTTKVLWFDWERRWWGSLNVIETTDDGKPVYWYDIPQPPSAQSIENIRVVTFSDRQYLEVIDCTHMGNGMLYLYEVRAGVVRLKLKARVITNLLGVGFEPRIARVEYRDLDGDGFDDIILRAEWIDSREPDDSETRSGGYKRVFYYRNGSFQEDRSQRQGREAFFD